jgi:hypothetical protein
VTLAAITLCLVSLVVVPWVLDVLGIDRPE